jgi:hypothetical protein
LLAMATEPLCFLSAQPAVATLHIPALGWGGAYAKAAAVEVSASAAHSQPPPDEEALVAMLLRLGDATTARPDAAAQEALWHWLDRLARGIFYQVYQRPWPMPLVLVSGKLGVPPAARDLYEELLADLKAPLFDLYPEPGPYKRLDYHFFEVETEKDEDNVLWMRLPGGLVVYAWPGVL